MHAVNVKQVFFIFLFYFLNFVTGQDVDTLMLCGLCTCSEAPADGAVITLNILCSEINRIESLPDLDKIEWPVNPNGLKISATFQGVELLSLGKIPPNSQLESLRFNNNALKSYWPDPFSEVPTLRSLSLGQNDLTEVTPDLFTRINFLEELDLSYNKLMSFNSLDFKSLHNVNRFNLEGNLLSDIPIDPLRPMVSLEDVDLSKNAISEVRLRTSGGDALKGIKRLNLSGNRIRTIVDDSFAEGSSLEYLDLSNNAIETVDENAFLPLVNLSELNLAQNNITFIFALPPTLEIAVFDHNAMFHWPKFPKGITYVDMSYNMLDDLYDEKTMSFDHLEVLKVAGNSLKQLNINSRLPNLRSLDVSHNQLSEIPSSLNVINLPSLEALTLDGNPIRSIFFKEILKVKRLSMNELRELERVDDKAFQNVEGPLVEDRSEVECFSLSLSRCPRLSEIQEGAFDHTSLCMIDLSSNNLTSLAVGALPRAPRGLRAPADLQRNPWHCGCELQWLLDELLPALYQSRPELLTQLRCESPRALSGVRLVHWYNWTERVLCDDGYLRAGPRENYVLDPTSSRDDLLHNPLAQTLGACIVVALLVAIALVVYLVKTRRRPPARRKRQGKRDVKVSRVGETEKYKV